MGTIDDQHQLLPWFVTGKLDKLEDERFRAHLENCPACREELAFLRSVEAGSDAYGNDFFLEHPSSHRLVDAVQGFLAADEAAEILRHLELCDLCAAEARWVRGEEPAAERRNDEDAAVVPLTSRRERRSLAQWGGWFAAAAATILLALVVWQRPEPSAGQPESRLLVPTERAGSTTTRFTRGDRWPMPLIEIDFPRDAFPVRVEVSRKADGVVFRDEAVGRADLIGELYYAYACLEDCRPGEYSIRVTSGDPAEPVLEFRFEVAPDSRGQ